MRGATSGRHSCRFASLISTHTPHAGRDYGVSEAWLRDGISTHTPHAGRDRGVMADGEISDNFYSHAPCGARRRFVLHQFPCKAFLLTRPMRGAT